MPMSLPPSPSGEYFCLENLDLYDDPECTSLGSQAAQGRRIQMLNKENDHAVRVMTVEDGYCTWLKKDRLSALEIAEDHYEFVPYSRNEIEEKLEAVIIFAQAAKRVNNTYLWGGTTAPNYDCSGFVQSAFASEGIWLPRNSYQQGDFTESISLEDLLPGDLIFFAKEQRIDHVALYLGEGYYIHSSGRDMGRNGIEIDRLWEPWDTISRAYHQTLLGFGRVNESYAPPSLICQLI
ncbi:NLP/P60 protein [[Leptolyngbya] sp. PCC 7376]|uniref:C40 family peptidase n=1 Tax=[Leptolyngbya] sp. PCC 7376 TaxID=111781 RepID=UPI00029EFCF2|nr:NLP/P60 protein [[Leptolyngbya] sp. PCC 7376]